MSKNVMEISDTEFEKEVLRSDLPVMVDFWAPWCGPCRSLSPLIDELANEHAGKVKFVKVNVDDHKEYAMKYNVKGIPNIILFKGGQLHQQIVGPSGKQDLVDAITKLA